MNLAQKIESYLFMTASRSTFSQLAGIFDVSVEQINGALDDITISLQGHGIMLVRDDKGVLLATIPQSGEWFAEIRKKELSAPLSKGAYETLAIILYQGSSTKPEIDYIRGVNSQFMLRNLLIRGLIEKSVDKQDKRITRYKPSLDTYKFLGITDLEQLPSSEQFVLRMNEALGTNTTEPDQLVIDENSEESFSE